MINKIKEYFGLLKIATHLNASLRARNDRLQALLVEREAELRGHKNALADKTSELIFAEKRLAETEQILQEYRRKEEEDWED